MKRKLDQMTIGQTIFMVSTLIVASLVLITAIIMQVIFFSRLDKLIVDTSKEINKQVILNYEAYFSNVIETSNSLQEYIVIYTKDNDLNRLEELFESNIKAQANIKNISLISDTGKIIASSITEKTSLDLEETSWFYEALRYPDIHHFSSPHLEDVMLGGSEEVISVSKRVDYFINGLSQKAVLVIELRTEELSLIANRTNLGKLGHILITDSENRLVFDSSLSCLDDRCQNIALVKEIILGGKLIKYQGLNMYVSVNTLQDTRWKITTLINVDASVKTKQEILLSVIVAFIITLAAIAYISSWMSQRITHPMNDLKKHIEKLETGDFEAQVSVSGQKEVVHLADAFNIMSNKIHELMQEIIEEQNEKRKTHFIALQNQINPHFLYNTLDSIVTLSEKGKSKDVEKAIGALSRFFRMSVSSDMSLITLDEEIEHVQHYLTIQQLRYRKDFEYSIDIPQHLKNQKVIKLSLQPLVENAILYGLNPELGYKTIQISAYDDDDHIFLQVFNQGYGMSQSKIEELYKMIKSTEASSSLGLKNVYQRLKLYFGDRADLIIESELDVYTKVTLRIPKGELG